MADLLLELFSEEIPARMQARAAADLERSMKERLREAGYAANDTRSFAGPRRLTFVATGLPARQEDRREERKGPRVGAPDKAVEGFLRSAGLDRVDQAEVREDKKGSFYVAVIEQPGRDTADVIAEAVPAVVRGFPWPKSMRWGSGELRWVRPLRRVLCTFDGEVVPFTIENGDRPIVSGDLTEGHRFMAPGTIQARSWESYDERLRAAKVVLDADVRAERILGEARALCQAQGLELVEDAGLLAEVAGLAEWPVPRIGRFDEAFLSVPDEVLTAAMRGHQKYFSVRDPATGRLAPRFVTVANVEPADGGAAMMAGYERVLTARLSDALFLYDQDRKKTLDQHAEKLSGVTFFEGLGTIADKVERVAALAREIAPKVGADPDLAERAARLSKADLTTEMVGEFPELQGVMGRYYALDASEPAEVADAIRDHYEPSGQGAEVPTAPVSVAVALADKLATLAMFWAIDEKPTGSKDPFALRRMALGVIALILPDDNRVQLRELLSRCLLQEWYVYLFNEGVDTVPYPNDGTLFLGSSTDVGTIIQNSSQRFKDFADSRFDGYEDLSKFYYQVLREEQVSTPNFRPTLRAVEDDTLIAWQEHIRKVGDLDNLLAFFHDRLTVYLRDQGHRHDHVAAVLTPDADDLVLVVRRLEALVAFLATPDGENLTAAYKRAANILRAEGKKGDLPTGDPDPALFVQEPERAMFDALNVAEDGLTRALDDEDFQKAMSHLATLRAPLDAFFEDVTVNDEDAALRANRLRLLARIKAVCERVADLGKLEG